MPSKPLFVLMIFSFSIHEFALLIYVYMYVHNIEISKTAVGWHYTGMTAQWPSLCYLTMIISTTLNLVMVTSSHIIHTLNRERVDVHV